MKTQAGPGIEIKKGHRLALEIAQKELDLDRFDIEVIFSEMTPARAKYSYATSTTAGDIVGSRGQRQHSKLYGLCSSYLRPDGTHYSVAQVFCGWMIGWTVEAQVWTLLHEIGHAYHSQALHDEYMVATAHELEVFADEIGDRLFGLWLVAQGKDPAQVGRIQSRIRDQKWT